MHTIGAVLHKWTPFLLLCSLPTYAQPTNETTAAESSPEVSVAPLNTSTTSTSSSTTHTPIRPSDYESTCAFRTINYITHTLPQQCLKTGWTAPTEATSTEGAEGRAATPSWAGIPWTGEGIEHDESEPQPEGTRLTVGAVEETGIPDTSSKTTEAEPEVETDSPLDNANFLSFEEWKMKNLAAAGQSPENIGQARAASSEQRNRRRPVNVNALDALGEESEIEIDFSGFGNVEEGANEPSGSPSGTRGVTEGTKSGEEDNVAPTAFSRSKDAGKTCKERFNYASFDCAATVLKTNNKAKSSSAVLVENKDSYMLNECSADNKFVIVELCDDILVDTIVLANYEFFSSMFRHFRVSVSDRYPVKMDRWRTLATFEARNSRDIQPFLINEPQIWARYLRIEFLTHYGNEFYCPMSLLRVHGTTMMEQFRREEEEARGDDDFAEPIEAADGEPIQTAEPVAEASGAVPAEKQPTEPEKRPESEPEVPVQVYNASEPAQSVESFGTSTSTTQQTDSSGTHSSEPARSASSNETTATAGSSEVERQEPSAPPTESAQAQNTSTAAGTESPKTEQSKATSSASSVASAEKSSSSQLSSGESKSSSSTTSSSQTGNTASKASTSEVSGVSPSSATAKVSSNSTANGSPSQVQPRGSSQTQPNPAVPSTQESFFKSIHKRLQHLEMNSTLSLQYIEEQSRILRDAFMKVEKQQMSKTTKFLDHLNTTVMGELKSYRSMYDQLWQSTILELEGMKERQKTEIGEIGARLSLVADELVWQKRMAVVQSTLLLLCLGLVLFVRSGTLGSQQDVPIVQQIGNKYSQFFDSPPRSPENSGQLRRRRTFRNMWRSDTSAGLSGYRSDGATAVSDAETDGRSPNLHIGFSPPTSNTPSAVSDLGRETGDSPPRVNGVHASAAQSMPTGLQTPTSERENSIELDDAARRIEVLATQSGPATPHGSRDSRPSWEEVERAVDKLKAEEQGRTSPLLQEPNGQKRGKRSPLRRATSYDGTADDSPCDDDGDGMSVGG